VLVEGLPGIGNAGKVAVDFLIDTMRAKKIMEFESQQMPHSVFVNERGLVELPRISMYAVERGRLPLLLLISGDVQPVNEESCYDFCETVLEVCKELQVEEIITLAGIGLRNVPKKPKVYVTGTTKDVVKPYLKFNVSTNIYGTVGPIIGVSGVLCGLAGREKFPSVALLVEVFGHPLYLGVRGAKELLRVLNSRLTLKLNFKEIEKEIETLESELTDKAQDMSVPPGPFGRIRKQGEDLNYIG
jgi:proteasome assembly chaperone (PAC2) family protein